MESHILFEDDFIISRLQPIFTKIIEKNAILFLGAGAAITDEKIFLSNHIIQLYQDHIHKDLKTNDITEFVDLLSSQKDFSRIEFDDFVFDLLNKLEITGFHKTIASEPWREIITTNFDLLIERSYDDIRNTSESSFKIIPIRNKQEYNRTVANDEIRYVKLNGCCSDRKKFPFVISTDDFSRAKSFYNIVIADLKNVSDNISFLSAGYSFSDVFSKKLLDKFDGYDYRSRRWFHTIDPEIDENRLDYLTANKIRVIKLTTKRFFELYEIWKTENEAIISQSKRMIFLDSDENRLNIPPNLLLKLDSSIVQLHKYLKHKYITPESFYEGEDPDYGVILKNYDIVRSELIDSVREQILSMQSNVKSNLVQIVLIKGNFGIGKSTFTYRLLNSIMSAINNTILSFEVVDPFNIDIKALTEILSYSKSKAAYFYFNYVERESVFNALLEFRNKLSREQINSHNIIVFASVRDNLLERYKYGKDIQNLFEINMDFKLNDSEILELVEKLKKYGLKDFRDIKEKNELIKKIKYEFCSDSYITLLNLVKGKHFKDLIEAYNQLPVIARKALLYTSLLHQYNILMPIGLLKDLIAKDWDIFRNEFLIIDCKGLLIQVMEPTHGVVPDSYFKTKHQQIAKTLVDNILPNLDDQFNNFEKLFAKLTVNKVNSRLVSDLLKYFREHDVFSIEKINRLFDLAYQQLSEDHHFLLIYCINLQFRQNINSLEKALRLIIYAESLIDHRNYRLIHRRAVINFEIAKFYFKKESGELVLTVKYLREAEELFNIKLLLDPCSSYSYVNFIEMLLWILDNIVLSDTDYLRRQILIDELFELAERTVFEDYGRIMNLQSKYVDHYLKSENETIYLEKLNNYYNNTLTRPLALILLFNYFNKKQNINKCNEIFPEIESCDYNDEVCKFLFKYYGRNLHVVQFRIKFFDLVRYKSDFQNSDSLRYNYFMYIANDYNFYFEEAKKYINNIVYGYEMLHPDYKISWKNEDNNDRIFDTIIVKNKRQQFRLRVPELQKNFRILKNDKIELLEGKKIKAKLFFFLTGIRAELIEIMD